MKRFLTIVLCIFMSLAFTACGGVEQQKGSDSSQTTMDSNGGGNIELPEDKFN